MDGLRNYPDEPETRWYSERYRADGDDRYDGYRVPDPRYEEPAKGWAFEPAGSGAGSLAPPEPAPFPAETADPFYTQALDSSQLQQSGAPPASGPPVAPPYPAQAGIVSGGPAPSSPAPPQTVPPQGAPAQGAQAQGAPGRAGEAGGSVYRTRRAGVAALLAGGAIFAELLLVRVLLVAEFGAKGTPGGVLAGLFALAGVPLVALGLHGLTSGAAAAGPTPARQWLRVPLAYLPVGLILLVAAAIAIS
ncbi:MAG TPA: hypothetical protein VJT31_39315 [Rugosimonospora sp.]|nr:hypothetical protein [Rugosimonospora sp.]